ncbi:MAG: glycosyltransferase, partial [Polyangiales bacterium]
ADPERASRALPEPLEHAALSAALTTFGPDLVVFDTHAPNALVEHATALGARSVLVQRELRPELLRAFLASKAARAFDRIVVPHDPAEISIAEVEGLPLVIAGHVVRALDTRLPARWRRRLDPEAPLVVAMAGGGGQPIDAHRFLRAAADAHLLTRARVPRLQTLLIAGPYGVVPEHLEAIAGLVAMRACDELPALLARADVVVSQAGYNAVCEIRTLEKPAILVPGYRKAEDQRARARRLVEIDAALLARPEARSIASRLESLLLDPSRLAIMKAAHRALPLEPKNRAVAEEILRPIWSSTTRVRRAVIVAHDFAPRLGGMETAARALAKGLLAQGVDVRVYTAKHFGAALPDLAPERVRRLYNARSRRGAHRSLGRSRDDARRADGRCARRRAPVSRGARPVGAGVARRAGLRGHGQRARQ